MVSIGKEKVLSSNFFMCMLGNLSTVKVVEVLCRDDLDELGILHDEGRFGPVVSADVWCVRVFLADFLSDLSIVFLHEKVRSIVAKNGCRRGVRDVPFLPIIVF